MLSKMVQCAFKLIGYCCGALASSSLCLPLLLSLSLDSISMFSWLTLRSCFLARLFTIFELFLALPNRRKHIATTTITTTTWYRNIFCWFSSAECSSSSHSPSSSCRIWNQAQKLPRQLTWNFRSIICWARVARYIHYIHSIYTQCIHTVYTQYIRYIVRIYDRFVCIFKCELWLKAAAVRPDYRLHCCC